MFMYIDNVNYTLIIKITFSNYPTKYLTNKKPKTIKNQKPKTFSPQNLGFLHPCAITKNDIAINSLVQS